MNIPRLIALCRLLRGRGAGAAVTLAAALASAQMPALAGAKVGGNPQAVTVDARNSSIEDILATLGREFEVHYRSSVDLKNKITGTYEGSLPRVVSRILEGYNFVLKSTPGGIEVTVLGKQNASTARAGTIKATSGPGLQEASKAATAPSPIAQQSHAAPSAAASAKAPAAAAPAPQITLAEGAQPGPMPGPSTAALPMPVPVPETKWSIPMPAPASPGSNPGPMPELLKSDVAPPTP